MKPRAYGGRSVTCSGSPRYSASVASSCRWQDRRRSSCTAPGVTPGIPAVPLDLPVDRNIRSSGRPSPANLAREARTTVTMAGLIAKVARRGDDDALWANAHWTHLDAALAGRLCGKPVVLHLHEEPMPGLGQRLRGVAVQLATQSVAVSQAVATGLPRSVRRRVTVIPNGVDTEAMSPPTEDDVVVDPWCSAKASVSLMTKFSFLQRRDWTLRSGSKI